MFLARILLLSLGLLPGVCDILTLYKPSVHPHPFFVSVSEIRENAKEKILEITNKIFTDDFEKDLRKEFKTHVDLLKSADRPAMDKLVTEYIKTHLRVFVDGKPCLLQFVGYEQDEEAVECYFQVSDIKVNKTVSVNDNILFDYKPEQVNIVHVTVKGTRKSTQLVNPDSKASFDFP